MIARDTVDAGALLDSLPLPDWTDLDEEHLWQWKCAGWMAWKPCPECTRRGDEDLKGRGRELRVLKKGLLAASAFLLFFLEWKGSGC